MVRLVTLLAILLCVLQAANCSAVSLNYEPTTNSTRSFISNHVNADHAIQVSHGWNGTARVTNNFQDILNNLLIRYGADESSIDSSYNAHGGLRLKRSQSQKQGRREDRGGTSNQSSKRKVPVRKSVRKCSGRRTGRRSRIRTGSSTRLRGRRNRRMKTNRCPQSKTVNGNDIHDGNEERNEDNDSNDVNEEQDTDKYETCACCSGPQKRRSKRHAPCDPTALSTKNAAIRERTFKSLRDDRSITKYSDIIKTINVNQDLSTNKLITSIPGKEHLIGELANDGDSSRKMRELRTAWRENAAGKIPPTDTAKLRAEFLDIVKKMPEMAGQVSVSSFSDIIPWIKSKIFGTTGVNTNPLTEDALKHMFYGEEKINRKKLQFSGLHDGSAFHGIEAHDIIGGKVTGVRKVGPGVAVDIEKLKVKWNTNGPERTKKRSTIFIGVPPKYQAAFYLGAYNDDIDPKNEHNDLATGGRHTGSVFVQMQDPEPGAQPFKIQAVKNIATDKFITAYPIIP